MLYIIRRDQDLQGRLEGLGLVLDLVFGSKVSGTAFFFFSCLRDLSYISLTITLHSHRSLLHFRIEVILVNTSYKFLGICLENTFPSSFSFKVI